MTWPDVSLPQKPIESSRPAADRKLNSAEMKLEPPRGLFPIAQPAVERARVIMTWPDVSLSSEATILADRSCLSRDSITTFAGSCLHRDFRQPHPWTGQRHECRGSRPRLSLRSDGNSLSVRSGTIPHLRHFPIYNTMWTLREKWVLGAEFKDDRAFKVNTCNGKVVELDKKTLAPKTY